ncbi:MAG: hypothetical protein FJZ90_06190 [Chloroflexi bacterium]|nr:hypothetical protein [Chloroflexota bacterium]
MNVIAFASLPFGLRGGTYRIATPLGPIDVHVSDLRFTPFVTITSRPELAQRIPDGGLGEGLTTYTWYDHPFVLRVLFGRNVASLGSINSSATIAEPLTDEAILRDQRALSGVYQALSERALAALNNLIAVVRHKARLHHVSDLRREDIEITVRRDDGAVVREDPLHRELVQKEAMQSERFDLSRMTPAWYDELARSLAREEPVGLAEDLLIEAERALQQRFPRQAIATCHTAIEAGTCALLTRAMLRRGCSDDEIDLTLSTKSLVSKLASLLRTYTGFSLRNDQRDLWNAFNRLNDLRNDIVHRGRTPDDEDAQFAIHVTRQLLNWLDVIYQRNAASLA